MRHGWGILARVLVVVFVSLAAVASGMPPATVPRAAALAAEPVPTQVADTASESGVGPVAPIDPSAPPASPGQQSDEGGIGPAEQLAPPPGEAVRPSPDGPSAPVAPAAPSPPPEASFLAAEETGWIPPDTDGAVGPDHLLVVVNGGFVIQDRSGGVLVSESLGAFWSGYWDPSNLVDGKQCESPFDPRVLYDTQSDRWYVVSIRGRSSCADRSALLVAVSTSGDPTGTWYRSVRDVDPTDTYWADFPTLGYSQSHVVVGLNMFLGGIYARPQVWALERPVNAASTKWVWRSLDPANFAFTLMPAATLDAGVATTYLASQWDSSAGYIALYTLTGPVGVGVPPSIGSEAIAYPQTAPWARNSATVNPAPQLGVSDGINNGDARMQGLVMRNGELWATHNAFLPAGTPTHTAIQWWNLQTDGTVIQQGLIDDPSGAVSRAYPSISVNASGDVLIGYSSFAADQYASANYSLRRATDPAGTFLESALLKGGEGPYVRYDTKGRNRWGDYSSTHVDPLDDSQFWTIQEFARPPSGPSGQWALWWGQVDPALVSAAEFAFYRPANGRWYVIGENSVGFSIAGELGDIVPVPADYDGDGAAEFAFYRPSNGRWYVIGESSVGFGFAGESDIVPVPADFDGDGAAEFGFYRPSNGRWYVIGENSVGFSTADIVPVPADYDGDGAEEFAFYRPSNGRWYVIGQSSVGYGFAGETDIVPVPADYE